MAKIGLVAGYGNLPIAFAQSAKAKGDTVIGFGIKGMTDESLAGCVDRMHWVKWGGLQKAALLVLMEGIRQVVLLGKIKKTMAFDREGTFDDDARKALSGIGGKKDYAILRGVEGVIKKAGITIIDPSPYLEALIPKPGTFTKRAPDEKEWADINYGREVARVMAGYDIGQTVAVKDKTVIALEAVEGTDETLARAGSLVSGGFVVVKMARPDQDMRFDVPLVGLETVEGLIKAGGTALALEAGRTFLIDRAEIIKLADEKSVAIVIV